MFFKAVGAHASVINLSKFVRWQFPIKSVNYMFLLDILLTFTAPFLYPAYDEFTGTQLQQAIVSHSTQK
ncbi:MAG: hypothetical protein AAGK26_16665, partial [Pseudomonadota bacterium]